MQNSYLEICSVLNKSNISPFGSYITATQYLKAYDLIAKYGQEFSDVLDWGAGSGHFSYFLLKQDFNVTGFIIDKPNLFTKSLEKEFSDQYKSVQDPDSVVSLPFEDNSFDIVVSIGVLEHVRDYRGNEVSSLLEFKRVLRHGGIFICYNFPNKYSWIEAITKRIPCKFSHNHKYNEKDIAEMVRDSGLEYIESKRYGIIPRNIFQKLPDNPAIAGLFNMLDDSLSVILNPICQNYYFVAKNSV